MQNVNEFQKKPFGRGQAFKCRDQEDGEEFQYIIGSTSDNRVGLVNLMTGKRWEDPVEVKDARMLTPGEATELFRGLVIMAGLTVTTKETPKKPKPTYRAAR